MSCPAGRVARPATGLEAIVAGSRAAPVWLLLDSRRPGGIETHVLVLARALVGIGVRADVVFYADHGPHPLRTALDDAGIRHLTVGGSVVALLGALRRARPIVVHTHGYKSGVLGRLAARLLGIPVVSTFHAGEPGRGWVRLYTQLDVATSRLAHCIAVSEPICERLPPGSAMIDNFVSLPAEDDRATPPPVATSVGFVGRLDPVKGPDEFCALAEDLPHLSFEIFGDGPMRASLERAFAGRVRFRGMVGDMSTHWRSIGLLCMPSRYEGLPMALLEAMAHGVPVAAYAVGGIPRVIEHGRSGWLARPGDRAGLRDCIEQWSRQDAATRAATRRSARGTIALRFSCEAAIGKVLDVYARALG